MTEELINNIVQDLRIKGYFKINIRDIIFDENIKKYYELNKKVAEEMRNYLIDHPNVNFKREYFPNKTYLLNLIDYSNHIKNPEINKHLANLFYYVSNDFFLQVAAGYYNEDPVDIICDTFFLGVNYHNQTERVAAQNWHRDPLVLQDLKCFTFFNGANVENGALEYIPHSHRTCIENRILTNLRTGNRGLYADKNEIKTNKLDEKSVLMECEPGDIVFADTTGFHRAGILQKDNYRLYTHISYYPRHVVETNPELPVKDVTYRYHNKLGIDSPHFI